MEGKVNLIEAQMNAAITKVDQALKKLDAVEGNGQSRFLN